MLAQLASVLAYKEHVDALMECEPILPGELTKEEKKEIGNYTKNILLEQLKENPAR